MRDEYESIHIVDRRNDVIISGGENISSAEIEDCLYRRVVTAFINKQPLEFEGR